MADPELEPVQKQRQTTVRSGNTVQTTNEVVDPDASTKRARAEGAHQQNVAVNVVWYIFGLLEVLLAFRFVLTLLGANQANGFANFIYSVSHPFVAPFFSLFNYRLDYGVSHFELYTLIAMAVYALIAWGIARLLTINRD